MKKRLLSLALVMALGLAANAQTEGAVQKLSIGAEAGIPTNEGTSGLMYAGGSVQYEHPIAKSFNLTGYIGYLSLFSTEKGVRGNQGYTSFKVGGKYYFCGNFYASGDLGAAIRRDGGRGFFVYSPGLGAAFSIADKSSLDFGLRYETRSRYSINTSLVALRMAFAFGL